MARPPVNSSILHGVVAHRHGGSVQHRFRHRVSFYLLDLDELPRLEQSLRPLFGFDRRAMLALRTRDHLALEAGVSLRDRAESCLRRADIVPPGGRIQLLCNLAVVGYVFDPVSLWYCRDADDRVQHVIVEVHNTYGESHPYVVSRSEQTAGALASGTWTAVREKQFHVSPFLDLDMRYDLAMTIPAAGAGAGDALRFSVQVAQNGAVEGPVFAAAQSGRRAPLTRTSALVAQLRTPFMPQRIWLLIRWQALRLHLRGARFRTKPAFTPHIGSR